MSRTPRLGRSVVVSAVALAGAAAGLSAAWRPMPPPARAESRSGERFDGPAEAQRFFAMKRAPHGQTAVPTHRYAAARQMMRLMPRYSTAAGEFLPVGQPLGPSPNLPNLGTWTMLGPANIGGRTRGLVFDPTTSAPNYTIYAAGVAGGVWKSTNGGATWLPKADNIANIAVNSLAISSTGTTLLAGTGEGFFNSDYVRGNGIFKSTDSGATWAQLAATNNNPNFYYVNDLLFSTLTPGNIFAATGVGVLRSTDSGTTWSSILSPNLIGGCLDLAMRTDQQTLLASCGTFYDGNNVAQGRVYKIGNVDSATPDAPIQLLPAGSVGSGMGRTSIALAPGNQNRIYALATNAFTHAALGVYRSDDGGATFAKVSSGAAPSTTLLSGYTCGGGGASQGWYDNVIAVDPTNPTVVWVGGIDLFRSDDAGVTWGYASNGSDQLVGVHPDQHALAFPPDYNGAAVKTLFVGNDGGLYRIDDTTGATDPSACSATGLPFTNLNNGYAATQFYHGAAYPDDTRYFGGTQDNGTLRGDDVSGPNNWSIILGGDGGAVAVDPTNTNTLYGEHFYLSINKSTDAGATWKSATTGISNSGFQFTVPVVMDPNDPQVLWTGGNAMWRTKNGAGNWSRASATLSGGVSSIAVAPSNSNVVAAGIAYVGKIYVTTRGLSAGSTTAWASSVAPRADVVSSLTFDPYDATTLYATYSNFNQSSSPTLGHVWKSTDSGASWTALDVAGQAGSLPDIPVHSLVVDPTNTSRLYVGTDIGVFVSLNGGSTWAVENTGFPNVITDELVINGSNLYAFTHGRGAARVALTSTTPTVSVRMKLPSSIVNEGTTAAIEVELQTSNHGATTGQVTVDYATSDGTAVGGTDYAQTSGTLIFAPGSAHNATQTISVPILDNSVANPTRTFRVDLSNVTGTAASLNVASSHLVTIQDDASLQFKYAVTTVSEAAANAVITVTRTENTSSLVTVDYATSDGSATAGSDYTSVAGTLTFTPGLVSKTFNVPIGHDTNHEPAETVMLKLSNPTGAGSLGAQRTAVINITDNDAAPALQFSAATYTVSEAGPSALVTVKRTGSTAAAVQVDYTTNDGTATAGLDYALSSGTLTFGIGVLTQTFSVPIIEDTLAEPTETVKLALSNPAPLNQAVLGTLKTATLSITDNDQAVQWSAAAYSVAEASPKAILTVKRSGGITGTLTVDYAVSGGGTATGGGVDYDLPAGSLTFAQGVTSKTLAVTIVNDALDEGSETVNVSLSNALLNGVTPLTILGTNPTILTILDNEPVVQFNLPKYTVSEASPKATITVKRTGSTALQETVDFATSDGTATVAGGDYKANSGTLTFGPGKATATFTVDITNDTVDEPNETVNLTLSNPSSGLKLGTPFTTTLTITDNDTAGKTQFSVSNFSVDAATRLAAITLTRTAGTASGATVACTLGAPGDSATAPADYTNVGPVTVTFGLGQTTQTFTIPVNPVPGPNKFLTLTLGGPLGGNLALGSPTTALLWIVE